MKKKDLVFSMLFGGQMLLPLLLLVVLAGAMAELTPVIRGEIISAGIAEHNFDSIITLSVVLVIALLLDTFARGFLHICATRAGFDTAKKMRSDFFYRLMRQPYQFLAQKCSGDMVFRANIYIFSIGSFLAKSIADTAINIARFALIFVYMVFLDARFALALAVVYGLAIVFATILTKKTYVIGKNFKQLELQRNSLMLHNLNHMKTYLAYNDNFEYLPHYNQIDGELDKYYLKFYRLKHWLVPALEFFASLGTVFIYHLAFSITPDLLQVGVVVAMLTFATRLTTPIKTLSVALTDITENQATANKIMHFLQKPNTPNRTHFDKKQFDISCQNLTFSNLSTAHPVQNFSLDIPFGQKIAITGAYGSGKTAFSELLLGLNQPQSGKVLFDGVDVQTIRRSSFCKLISATEDNVSVLDGTILENLHFVKPTATQDQVLEALNKAGLDDLIASLPRGVHTHISAKTITQQTRQLLSFARVILKNTPVVIVDEFARDLGKDQTKKFYGALKRFAKNKTLIFICQEAPNQLKFDKIIKF